MRASAGGIVETCVDAQKTGWAQEFFIDLDVFYSVGVDRSRARLLREPRNQKLVLDGLQARNRRNEDRPFWNPIYLV